MITRNTIVSIIFLIISAVVLLINFSVINRLNILLLSEIVLVIGWVFLWEAVQIFFIDRHKLIRAKYRYINIIEAKISFEKLDNADIKK